MLIKTVKFSAETSKQLEFETLTHTHTLIHTHTHVHFLKDNVMYDKKSKTERVKRACD